MTTKEAIGFLSRMRLMGLPSDFDHSDPEVLERTVQLSKGIGPAGFAAWDAWLEDLRGHVQTQ